MPFPGWIFVCVQPYCWGAIFSTPPTSIFWIQQDGDYVDDRLCCKHCHFGLQERELPCL